MSDPTLFGAWWVADILLGCSMSVAAAYWLLGPKATRSRERRSQLKLRKQDSTMCGAERPYLS